MLDLDRHPVLPVVAIAELADSVPPQSHIS